MKSLLLIAVGFALGMIFVSMKSSSSQVTFNEKGAKTVVSTCDKEKECIISIGQQCENVGYKVVSTDHDDMKTILTAECGPEKPSTLLSFGK